MFHIPQEDVQTRETDRVPVPVPARDYFVEIDLQFCNENAANRLVKVVWGRVLGRGAFLND